ncbi:MAG TPA: ABC transporter substrate-binding protein [Streptosporangiaceae bacterium]|nr:ABC transporter substrate-binding protein [Streptosporangiaceae bacterium]
MTQHSPNSLSSASFSRRSALKGLAVTAGLAAVPGALAACGSSGSGSGSGGGNAITFGSNYSDPAPKQAFGALVSAAQKKTGIKITVNTVDHNTFQQDITAYLQGTPNDLATWFAGYRMQFFARQGLLEPIDDVWEKIGGNFNEATKSLCKGLDGHYYFVPIYNYPWVIFYNKSTFASKGYQVPATWDELITLSKQMQKDKLVPFAFADKDLWPALGMFDILDLRINGYDYHINLMHNQAHYTDPQVTAVFNQWRELMPYLQSGANGRIWEDAAKALETKQAGMMFQGTNQVAAQYVSDNADLSDLSFFQFPAINPAYGQDYMDAPMDGFVLPAKAKNKDAAKKVLEYIGTGPAEASYLKYDEWDVALVPGVQVPSYNAIQKLSVQDISTQKAVSQFGDRDTDPAMAAAAEQAIQQFINNPTPSTISSIQNSLANQAKTIFGS